MLDMDSSYFKEKITKEWNLGDVDLISILKGTTSKEAFMVAVCEPKEDNMVAMKFKIVNFKGTTKRLVNNCRVELRDSGMVLLHTVGELEEFMVIRPYHDTAIAFLDSYKK